jgi:hypothetical protein
MDRRLACVTCLVLAGLQEVATHEHGGSVGGGARDSHEHEGRAAGAAAGRNATSSDNDPHGRAKGLSFLSAYESRLVVRTTHALQGLLLLAMIIAALRLAWRARKAKPLASAETAQEEKAGLVLMDNNGVDDVEEDVEEDESFALPPPPPPPPPPDPTPLTAPPVDPAVAAEEGSAAAMAEAALARARSVLAAHDREGAVPTLGAAKAMQLAQDID